MYGSLKMLLITLGLVILSADMVTAGCGERVIVNGIAEMLCLDDETEIEFTYLDLSARFTMDAYTNDTQAGYAAYTAYISGSTRTNATTANSTDLNERDLVAFWNVCKDNIAGVCSNTNVITWTDLASAFTQAVTSIIQSVQGARGGQSPRSVCNNYSNDGTICVSWATYNTDVMSQAQITDVAQNCRSVCQANGESCEIRVTGTASHYFCVSDRAKGCAANEQLTC